MEPWLACRSLMAKLIGLLVPFVLVACAAPVAKAPDPSCAAFTEALTKMCDVDRLAGVTADSDPLGAGQKRTAWITAHVDNPDAIELRTLMSVKAPAEQAKMLRERGKEAGVARCALADTLEKSSEGGLSP